MKNVCRIPCLTLATALAACGGGNTSDGADQEDHDVMVMAPAGCYLVELRSSVYIDWPGGQGPFEVGAFPTDDCDGNPVGTGFIVAAGNDDEALALCAEVRIDQVMGPLASTPAIIGSFYGCRETTLAED